MTLANEVNAQIGANIKRLRKQMNVSSTKLAEAINVSQSTISGWETGKVFPRSSAIEKMVAYFGVDRADLLIDVIDNSPDLQESLLSDGPLRYGDHLLCDVERAKINAIIKAVLSIE